jgi:hypothetical protein
MPDLIDRDRFRIARYVATQIDIVKELGAVPPIINTTRLRLVYHSELRPRAFGTGRGPIHREGAERPFDGVTGTATTSANSAPADSCTPRIRVQLAQQGGEHRPHRPSPRREPSQPTPHR